MSLPHSATAAAIKEKASIWNKENAPSTTPRASPILAVAGGDANAAMITSKSAKLTMAVAMSWKAVAALSAGYVRDESETWLAVRGGRRTMK